MAQKKNPGGRPSFEGVIHTWKVPSDIEELYKQHDINWIWDAIRQFHQMNNVTQRFKLGAVGANKWRVSDTINNIHITFVEGLYNTFQEVDTSDYTGSFRKSIIHELSDHLKKEHPQVATCNIEARKSVIGKLTVPTWFCLTNALNGFWDNNTMPAKDIVTSNAEDLLHYENFDNEHETEIIRELRSLTEEEAREAINLVSNFFKAEIYSFPEWVQNLTAWLDLVKQENYLKTLENKLYTLTTERLRGYVKDNWQQRINLQTGNYIDTLRQYNDDIEEAYDTYLTEAETDDTTGQRAQNFLANLEELLDQINHDD